MLAWVLLAEQLGSAKFGILSWGLAIVGYLSIFSDLGLGMYGAKGLAHGKGDEFVRAIRSLRLALSIGVFLIAVFTIWLLFERTTALVLCASCLWLVANALSPEWYFQGRSMLSLIAAIRFSSGFALLAGVLGMRFVDSSDVVWASLLRALADGMVFAILMALGWSRLSGSQTLSFQRAGGLVRSSLPMAAVSLLTALYASNFDLIVLAATRSAEEVGLYAAGYRVYLMLALFPKLILVQAFPRFVAAPNASLQGELDKFYVLAGAVAIPAAVATWLLASDIVLILYGPSYSQAAVILEWIVPAVVPLLLNAPLASLLIARDKTRSSLVAYGIALVASIATNLLLTPAYGAAAAAAAVILAELLVLVVSYVACSRAFGFALSGRAATSLALLGVSTFVSVQLGLSAAHWLEMTGFQSFALTIGLAAVVWALVVFLMRTSFVKKADGKGARF